jgi:hypothetical protein
MAVRQYPPKGVHDNAFNEGSDTLWLWVQPKKIITINRWNTRGPQAITTSIATDQDTYKLLMPTTYSTSQNHGWDKFETVGSKVSELVTEVTHASHNVVGIHGSSAKADAPLMYTDSDRREWVFEFQFIVHSDAYQDVWLPIQEFLRMSAPSAATGNSVTENVNISIPYVFSLQTKTGNGFNVPVLSVKDAVITSIQPKYEQPYISGYPSKAEMTITFKDLNVLFSDSYKTDETRNTIPITIRENGI